MTALTDETLNLIQASLDIAETSIGIDNDDRIEAMSRIQETLGLLDERELGPKAVKVLSSIAVAAEIELINLRISLKNLTNELEPKKMLLTIEEIRFLSDVWKMFMGEQLPQISISSDLVTNKLIEM